MSTVESTDTCKANLDLDAKIAISLAAEKYVRDKKRLEEAEGRFNESLDALREVFKDVKSKVVVKVNHEGFIITPIGPAGTGDFLVDAVQLLFV